MAGTIEVAEDMPPWSAASWLFDWVLSTIAEDVADVELAGELTEIVAENLGWLSLAELSPRERRDVRRAMNALTGRAASELRHEGAVALVNDLVTMARTALPEDDVDS